MEPKVKPSDAHRSQITSKLGHLGTVWRQLHANLGQQRHNMGNIAANEASSIAKKNREIRVKTGVLIGYVRRFEAMWASTWAETTLKRVQNGAKLRHLGTKLGCN